MAHNTARLTPFGRRLLVDRVEQLGWPVAQAAQAAGVSRLGLAVAGRVDLNRKDSWIRWRAARLAHARSTRIRSGRRPNADSPRPSNEGGCTRSQPQSQDHHPAQQCGIDRIAAAIQERAEDRDEPNCGDWCRESHGDTEGPNQSLQRVLPGPQDVAFEARPGPDLIHTATLPQRPIVKVRHRSQCARRHSGRQAASPQCLPKASLRPTSSASLRPIVP